MARRSCRRLTEGLRPRAGKWFCGQFFDGGPYSGRRWVSCGHASTTSATIPQAVEAVISAPTSRDNFQEFFQSRFNGSHATLQAAVKYSALSDAIEFRLLRAGEDNADGASGAPLSDSLAQELAEGFDEAFSRYI